jgi:putative selenium metabolism hydrolase
MPATADYNKIRAAAERLTPWSVDLLLQALAIPSLSGGERAMAELVRTQMAQIGFDEIAVDDLGSVVGTMGAGPCVVAFDAHLDAVPPANDLWSGTVRGGAVEGRGAVDQKGGLAALLAAARIVKQLGLARDLTFVVTATVLEEECEGLAYDDLIVGRGLHPQLIVLTEPTDMRLCLGHRGRAELRARITGSVAPLFSADPYAGVISKASRIVVEVERLNGRLRSDVVLGKGLVEVVDVTFAADRGSRTPREAILRIDRRLVRGDSEASVLEELVGAAHAAECSDAHFEIAEVGVSAYTGSKRRVRKFFPAWVTDADAIEVRTVARAYQAVSGLAPALDTWVFSTNGVATAGRHAIPTLGIGPGDERQCHAHCEACPVAQLTMASAVYAAIVAGAHDLPRPHPHPRASWAGER